MKPRVLMIGPGEEVTGGITALVRTLIPALESRVDLLYLPTVQERAMCRSGKISRENVALALSQYGRFLSALFRFHPQVVHVHTSRGMGWLKDTFYVVVARAWRCPVVLHMHGGDFGELYAKSSAIGQRYTRAVCSLPDAIICVSAEQAKRLGPIAPAERISTLLNCIDVGAVPPPYFSGRDGITRALFIGVVGPSKGTFDLLEAMADLKSRGHTLQLWIAGAEERQGDLTEARARLRELALTDRCELCGVVGGIAKDSLLREASFFVLPSYAEGLPMAIVEAMAAALPVVATPVGGVPEVVRDGYNGFLVPPGDVKALADSLATLDSDRDLRETMGRRSREIAERKLDVHPYVAQLISLYGSITGQKTPQGEADHDSRSLVN
jgi:glycosyltransferase involved in cell wall biosynthesis